MVAWSWPRQSYEASVLVVPLESIVARTLAALPPEHLNGVEVFDSAIVPPNQPAVDPDEPVPTSAVEAAVHEADVVLLITESLTAADTALVVEVADAARASGRLIGAAVISESASWSGATASAAAVVLRESVDNLVVIRDMTMATSFIDVLRGGERSPETINRASGQAST